MKLTTIVEEMLNEQRRIMMFGINGYDLDPADEPENEPREAGDFSGASEDEEWGGR